MSPAPRLFLLDVEGTIAPLSLIYEQLFPYARARFPRYLQERGRDAGVQNDLTLLAEENREETDPSCPRFASPEDQGRGDRISALAHGQGSKVDGAEKPAGANLEGRL